MVSPIMITIALHSLRSQSPTIQSKGDPSGQDELANTLSVKREKLVSNKKHKTWSMLADFKTRLEAAVMQVMTTCN